jgi:monovalent cation/hydrogen antiporter
MGYGEAVHPLEIFACLLAVVAVLGAVAARARIPYPVVLVLGGLGLAAIPGLPVPELDPDLIFLGFLPPLVYSAAFLSSTYELREAVKPISALAIGLVVVTMGGVAAIAHVVVGLDWPVAVVLGAIVAPTDPVAATTVARRLNAPDRLVTILDGEALINDGTGLTAYAIALGAVGTTFALGHAAGRLVVIALGGVAIGVAVGWAATRVRRLVDDARLETTLSLLTPFAAYLPADRVGASGVLAAVVAGLWVGHYATAIAPAPTRLQAAAVWEYLDFLLNAMLFLLVGLQLRHILSDIDPGSAGTLVAGALAIAGGVLGLRLLYVALGARRVGLVDEDGEPEGPRLNLRAHFILGLCGMRGAVSLAAALAIPITAHGQPFPDRSVVILLTYTTILFTLVLPGLTLPTLIRMLGLRQDDARRRQELDGRIKLTHAALARLESVADDGHDAGEEAIGAVRALYEQRLDALNQRREAEDGGHLEPGDATEIQRLRRDILAAQRSELEEMRGERELPDGILRDIEHDLDLEESRLSRT